MSRVFLWGCRLIALPGISIGKPTFFVVVGGAFDGGGLAGLVLGVEVFEVGDAPAAACASAEAFGDEGGDLWVFAREVGLDFAQRDAEAQADVVIGVHGSCSFGVNRSAGGRGVGIDPIIRDKERAWLFCLH